ncbi:MAG TPA: hypothetical protein VJZ50_09045, partial [Candidatus Limnocylindrales bacterium]|nr:hypothetical protein [Candidatus Limnocylindrales bacterium]
MLEIRVGQARLLTLTLAFIVATGPSATARWLPEPPSVAPTAAAAADDRIADLAASLDYDLERIFRFVADEIRYEPYVGILRGAAGTLDAGAGNSLDQALLLARLLDESLIPYRFVRGALDATAAGRLVESMLMDTATASAAAEVALGGGPYPTPVEVAEPDPADAEELATIQSAAETALQGSGTQVSDSVALITNALAEAGVALGDGNPTIGTAGLLPEAETTSHTWIQAAFGANWLDLDPTLGAQAVIGDTLGPAAEVLDALPDELRHVIRFQVLLERVRGDGLETSSVLEYSGFADELAGTPITLAHIQPGALERLGVTISSLLGEGELAYPPILQIPGGSIVADEAVAFGLSGTDAEGGLLDDSGLFDDEGSPGTPAFADGEASAEWLAVTVESPDRAPLVARRSVFDRVPPEARHGVEPTAADVQPIELIPFAASGDLDFAPLLGSDAFAISTGPTSTNDVLTRAAAPAANMSAILASSYLGLRDVVAAQHAIGDGVVAFVDRPGVVSFSVDVGMSGDEPTLWSAVDIWHRSLGAMPTQDGTAALPGARLLAGVVEHVAERLALEAGPDAASDDDRSVGVSRVFEAAAEAGIPTLVLQGSIPSGATYDPVATALIDE